MSEIERTKEWEKAMRAAPDAFQGCRLMADGLKDAIGRFVAMAQKPMYLYSETITITPEMAEKMMNSPMQSYLTRLGRAV